MQVGFISASVIYNQMKSHTHTRQPPAKTSAREDSRKNSSATVSNIMKKINRSLPMGVPTKSLLLNSHRSKPRVESIVLPHNSQQISVNHSRKLSINSTCGLASGRLTHEARREDNRVREEAKMKMQKKEVSKQTSKCKQKEHNRSNSTISKKSAKQTSKNCFRIDLSKLVGKEIENKIVLEPRGLKKENENRIVLESKEVNRIHFDYQYVIGKGGFGKVWSVEFKRNRRIFAMKEMLKSKIIAKRSIHSVLNERELLAHLKHPFLVNMAYAFQDRQSLYLVMDLLVGGDLRYHMGTRRRFKESEAKFFIACILTGLDFLHLKNIIHRDIKPENLVFDDKGYLRITDLGIARVVKLNNSADTSGTPGYMAPQVMCRQDHSFPVDHYAVGIITYELMLSRRPYIGQNRKEIRDHILAKQVQVKAEEVPLGWSLEAADFINKMIQRKPVQRLGTENGINQIKEHPWFKNFAWSSLQKKTLPSPFVPKNILDSNDYRDQISSSSEGAEGQQDELCVRGNQHQIDELFKDYKYYSKEKKDRERSEKSKDLRKQSTNAATTTNTHYSYFQEKETSKAKPKHNNFLKL